MTKSSKQILLVAILTAIMTSALIYFVKSNSPSDNSLSATAGSSGIEETERIATDDNELSMGGGDTGLYGPVPEKPTIASAMAETVSCLKEKGVVIYGSRTCPACAQMVTLFKGYEIIDPIYVECQTNGLRCSREMQTQYVPEVQIAGNLFKGPATPAAIAAAVGCPL